MSVTSHCLDHIELRVPSLAVARPFYRPGYDDGPGCYAVLFEDPCGNRLEICHRKTGAG